MVSLVPISLLDFAVLAIATRALAWYWANAGIGKPLHGPVERWLKRKGWPPKDESVLEAMSRVATEASEFVSELTAKPSERKPKDEVPFSQSVYRFIHKGWTCALCSGQWVAFGLYSFWLGKWPVVDWDRYDLTTMVAINGVGVIVVQGRDIMVSLVDLFPLRICKDDDGGFKVCTPGEE